VFLLVASSIEITRRFLWATIRRIFICPCGVPIQGETEENYANLICKEILL